MAPHDAVRLATIACICAVSVTALLSTSILLGQTAPFTGGVWEPAGPFDRGFLAALYEANTTGGVRGAGVALRSLDDQYNVSNIAPNLNLLMSDPDVFILAGLMGSATVAAAVPIATAAGYPLVGPSTGSAIFRETFNPYVINIRAGYNDEALAMLHLLVEVMRLKRISMIYQSDSFGSPSKIAIEHAMSYMGLSLVSLRSYNVSASGLNYSSYVADVVQANANALILFAVKGFAIPFLTAFFANTATASIVVAMGSWIGDDVRNFMQANNISPSNVFTTQVVPHPASTTSQAAAKFRAAHDTYMALVNASQVGVYDFFGIEGYLVGRAVVEMLKRIEGNLTRSAFMDAVYTTRMFEIDDLLLGPFSRDCRHPQAAAGRSSMCNCTQGLRLVSTMKFDALYEFTPATSDVTYAMTECWAPSTLVNRPTVAGLPIAGGFLPSPFGLSPLTLGFTTGSALAAPSVELINVSSVNTIPVSVMNSIGVATYLACIMGLAPTAPQNNFLVASGLSGGPVHEDISVPLVSGGFNGAAGVRAVRREQLFVLPPLEQEAEGIVRWARREAVSTFSTVQLFYSSACTIDVATPFARSAKSHGATLSASTYTTAAGLNSVLSSWTDSSTVVVIGCVQSPVELQQALAGVSNAVASTGTLTFVFLASEVGAFWELGVAPVVASASPPPAFLANVYFGSSMPLWTNATTSTFSAAFLSENSGLTAAQRMNPNTAVGYLVAGVMSYLQTRSTSLTPSDVLSTAYTFSVVTVSDLTLGPFADPLTCDTSATFSPSGAVLSTCGCNNGVRRLYFHSIYSIATGASTDASVSTTAPIVFTDCFVDYTESVTTSSNTVLLVAVIVPIAVVLIAGVVGFWRYREWRRLSHAPKDATKPFCAMFVTLKKEAALWDRYPVAMPRILERASALIDHVVLENECYRVKEVGSATLIVAKSPDLALRCADALQRHLERVPWRKKYLLKALAALDASDTESSSLLEKSTLSNSAMEESRRSSNNNVDQISLGRSSKRSMSRSGMGKDDSTSIAHSKSMCTTSSKKRRRDEMERLDVLFGISLHADIGRVTFLVDRKAYDYSGPVVDGAAKLSDITAGGQILLTQRVLSVGDAATDDRIAQHYDTETHFKEFAPVTLGSVEHHTLQFNCPGRPEKNFALPTEEDQNDGLAAALEQQATGVAHKKVTMATLYLERIDAMHRTDDEGTADRYRELLTVLYDAVREAKGYVHSVIGPRVVISFNAVVPTPQALRRVHQLLDDLSEAFPDDDLYCGVATESTLVGRFEVPDLAVAAHRGKATKREHTSLISRVGEISGHVLTQGMQREIRFAAMHTAAEEIEMFARVQYCDVVRLPRMAKPMGLLSVHGLKSGATDEWMYELEQGAKSDPYAVVNKIFDKVIRCGAEGISEAKEMLQTTWKPTDAVPESAVAALRNLLTLGSIEAYLAQSGSK